MMTDSKIIEKIILDVISEESLQKKKDTKCNESLYGKCTHHWECPSHKQDSVSIIVDAGACRIGNSLGSCDVLPTIARMIDHTLLKPEATKQQVTQLCEEAAKYNFASVCINPSWVGTAARILKGTKVDVCTVIGFPLGATSSKSKALEAKLAIEDGATEVDMVINIGFLKSKLYDEVETDIRAVVEAASCNNVLTKVILETCLLTDEEKVIPVFFQKMQVLILLKLQLDSVKVEQQLKILLL